MAARVSESRSKSEESVVAREVSAGILFSVWRRMKILVETSFLGFHHEMLQSTFVWLVSIGEASNCTDLIGRGTDYLGLRILT